MYQASPKRFLKFPLCILGSDQLKRHYNLGQYWLEVDIEDVASFDETLAEKLQKSPTETLPLVCRNLGTFISIK